MPRTGKWFITHLQTAHLEWGSHRHTNTRGIVYGEGYLQIPAEIAYKFKIKNRSSCAQNAEYTFSTADGFITNEKLLASGNQDQKEFAKQFHGSGNLKLIGDWFNNINARSGDRIKIEFISSSEILLSKL